jgi:hypothetical protein
MMERIKETHWGIGVLMDVFNGEKGKTSEHAGL